MGTTVVSPEAALSSQGGVQQPARTRGGLDPHPQGRSKAGIHTKEHMTSAGSTPGATGPWG